MATLLSLHVESVDIGDIKARERYKDAVDFDFGHKGDGVEGDLLCTESKDGDGTNSLWGDLAFFELFLLIFY